MKNILNDLQNPGNNNTKTIIFTVLMSLAVISKFVFHIHLPA